MPYKLKVKRKLLSTHLLVEVVPEVDEQFDEVLFSLFSILKDVHEVDECPFLDGAVV